MVTYFNQIIPLIQYSAIYLYLIFSAIYSYLILVFYNRIIITPILQNPFKILPIIIFVTTILSAPIVLCIVH